MNQYAFYHNADKCVTCKACVIACKDKNDLKPGRKFRKLHTIGMGSWSGPDANGAYTHTNAFSYSVSMACNHCANPACMASCPAGAIGKRDDGIVFIDRELCVGCMSCSFVCPYDAPSFDKDAMKMDKCDFCRELIGASETPACVAACLMQALEYGPLDRLELLHPEAVQQVAPLADPVQTNPSFLITPHRKYDDSSTGMPFNMPEEIQAYEK